MIKLKKWLFILSCLISSAISAQTNFGADEPEGSNLPGSLRSASKDGVVNVDLFTGIGTATIPIYERFVDGLDVGVSISNNLKGVRVDQVASPSGLGWDINAGGYITREVLGYEDDRIFYNNSAANHMRGAWALNFWNQGSLDEMDCFTAVFGGRSVKFFINRQVTNFNPNGNNPNSQLPNYNMGQNLIYTEPRSELKIDFISKWHLNNGSITVYNEDTNFVRDGAGAEYNVGVRTIVFYITDEKGNVFQFENGDEQLKYFPETTSSQQYYSTNKWNLTKITTHTGAVVNFKYAKTNFGYSSGWSEQIFETDSAFNTVNGTAYNAFVAHKEIVQEHWSGITSHIQEIQYPDGTTIGFDLGTDASDRCDVSGGFLLKSISVKGNYNNEVSNSIKYKFNYAYFHTPNSVYTTSETGHGAPCNDIAFNTSNSFLITYIRLKLKSIDRIGLDNASAERYYTFDYENQSLPDRADPGKDHFGYFNNAEPVEDEINPVYNLPWGSSVPKHKFYYHYWTGTIWALGYTEYGTPKTYSLSHAKGWNLNKVTNSNGGLIKIEYGAPIAFNPPTNQYSEFYQIDEELNKAESGHLCPDGLVVQKLIYDDGYNIDNKVTKEYFYSGGERFIRGGYYWYPKTVTNLNQPPLGQPRSADVISRVYCSYYVSTQNLFRGSNHGFSTVSEVTKGYNNEQISKTVYSFSNLSYEQNGVVKSSIIHETGIDKHTAPIREFKKSRMGLPVAITSYDANNNILSKRTNVYQENGNAFYQPNRTDPTISSQDGNSSREFSFVNIEQNGPVIHPGGGAYVPLRTDQHNLITSIDVERSNQQEISTVYDYTYDLNDNPLCTQWTNSKGQIFRKHVKYNYNYYYAGFHWQSAPWSKQFPVVDATWKMNGLNDSSLIDLNIICPEDIEEPRKFPVTFASALAQPLSASQFASQSLINVDNALLSFTSTPNLKRVKSYTLFNEHFYKALEIKHGEEEVYSSYVYDTVLKVRVAEVNNAKYQDIGFTSFEGGKTKYAVKGTMVADYNKGNFDFERNNIVLGTSIKPITGRYYYILSQGGPSNSDLITKNNLSANRRYVFSFWARSNDFTLLDGSQTITTNPMITKNGWTLYVGYVVGSNTPLTLSSNGSNVIIDEVRLYPQDAAMRTSTFEPLLGVSSSCDENNNIQYFEYDVQGRPYLVKDIDGNIITLTKMVKQGPNN